MAKVKTNGRDPANDLLGVIKPRGKKAIETAAIAAKAQRNPRVQKPVTEKRERAAKVTYMDNQRIKKIGDRQTRPDSNVGKAIGLLRPNMTFAEFKKAMDKTKNPLPAAGILGFLVKEQIVQVR